MESGLHVIGAIQRKTNHERNIMYGSWAVILSYYPILSLCPKPVREEQKDSFNQWEKEFEDNWPITGQYFVSSTIPGVMPRSSSKISCGRHAIMSRSEKIKNDQKLPSPRLRHAALCFEKKIVLGQNNLIFGSRHLILPAIKDKMLMI